MGDQHYSKFKAHGVFLPLHVLVPASKMVPWPRSLAVHLSESHSPFTTHPVQNDAQAVKVTTYNFEYIHSIQILM